MMAFRRFAVLFAAGVALAQPQSVAPPLPKFEVASVKPSGPQSVLGREGGPGTKDPTHYSFRSATLHDLIGIAWNVHYFQISSKLAVDKDRYDLIANVPEGASRDQFRLMMRNLLSERFLLKAHIESRDFPAYELVIAKNGLKLTESGSAPDSRKPASVPEGFPVLPAGPGLSANFSTSGAYRLVRLRGQQQTASSLADMLRTPGEEPVVDKTGLTGTYDFMLEYTFDMPGASRQ